MPANKSLRLLRHRQNIDTDFRESKTPRDNIPKLNAWEVVREKNVDQMSEVVDEDTEHNESNIRPYFDKEKYMKNNCINNRTKLQLDQVQNQESTLTKNLTEHFIDFVESGNSHSRGWITQRAATTKDESYRLGIKQFNRIKSNSSLKVEGKILRHNASSKGFASKISAEAEDSLNDSASKRNKSQDNYKKKQRASVKSGREKEYKRVKEYIQSKNAKRDNDLSFKDPKQMYKLSKREALEHLTFGANSTDVSSTEESKIMKKKKLSIEIPDSADEENTKRQVSNIFLPKDLGPHRSISVQNRTTTITQFASLSSNNDDDQTFNFAPTKVEENIPLKPGKEIVVPNFESTKTSVKRNGIVSAYAANTHQGIVRNYNEDRVSIILNIVKPPSRKDEVWPK